jgi:hypothetical protein
MLLNKSRKTALFIVGIITMMIALLGLMIGGVLYGKQKTMAESYWKTTCLVTQCIHFQPKYDQITFESQAHYKINGSCLVPNGCTTNPVNSTFVCYVNANSLMVALPSRMFSISVLSIGAIAAFICLVTGVVWGIMYLCDMRSLKQAALAVKAAKPRAAAPKSPTATTQAPPKPVAPALTHEWDDVGSLESDVHWIKRSDTKGAGQ